MATHIYRVRVEEALRSFIETMGEKNTLRDACEYALLNGGKRIRPILVLMIADALELGKDVMAAALSVEFFHTASLITDDLPCMDDDDLRRSRPSLHKVFGESAAVLASYALIAEGYGGIYRNGLEGGENVLLCLEAATRCAGIRGATNGQFLDLFPPDSSLDTIRKIIYQKTVTLFEISFIFGWLFGGGKKEKLETVRKCSYHLGMAFQIADDLLDSDQDVSHQNSINIAIAIGKERALFLFEEEFNAFVCTLKELNLWSASFQEIADWLKRYPEPLQLRI
jgi:geranylgeranyl diphosphate synthase type II